MMHMQPGPTTDEDALIAGIETAPFDDAPRLIYADWLQERGEEAKADYVRAVVRLLHSPDDPAAVAKCVVLEMVLDAKWRQVIGGRFEVAMIGSGTFSNFAAIFQVLLGLVVRDPAISWNPGEPVRLRGSLTREEAEAFVRTFGGPLQVATAQGGPPLKLIVRPMTDGSPGIFAPSEP
jgi:uncharacterized protein (TIGR02996 family)